MELFNRLMKKPLKLAIVVIILILIVIAIRQGLLPTTLQIFQKTDKPQVDNKNAPIS
jgi:hypothetical protein